MTVDNTVNTKFKQYHSQANQILLFTMYNLRDKPMGSIEICLNRTNGRLSNCSDLQAMPDVAVC